MRHISVRSWWPALVIVAWVAQVQAGENLADPAHLAFVTTGDTSQAIAIDTRSDRIAGQVDLGMVPSQILVSPAAPVLVATNGQNVVLADLARDRRASIPLAFPARRLLLSADGRRAGISDLTGGNLVIVSLPEGREELRVSGLPPMRDVMFAEDGRHILIASPELAGLGIVDLAQGKVSATITPSPPLAGGIAAFTRSPNGRRAFAIAAAGGPIGVFDLDQAKPLAQLAAGKGAVIAAPSGSGAYILIADEAARTFSIIHGDDLTQGAVLPIAGGLATVYSGWFDSVAFVPSRDRRSVLIYDLWRLAAAGEIALPDNPGPGAVTADGAKLYLPLAEKGAVAVIDAHNRRLATLIAISGRPTAVVVAAGYGICH